jgi:hypothetical protein
MSWLLWLAHLAPMGVGIEAKVADGDLAFVWDMGGCPGDELHVIHLLHLFGVFPIPIAHLSLLFQKGEPLQRKKNCLLEKAISFAPNPERNPNFFSRKYVC